MYVKMDGDLSYIIKMEYTTYVIKMEYEESSTVIYKYPVYLRDFPHMYSIFDS